MATSTSYRATRLEREYGSQITRAFRAVIDDVSRPKRSVTARINTATVDRYQTVILPSGGDCRQFLQAPAVLWEHGQDPTRGRLPIGRCTSLRCRKAPDDDIIAATEFGGDDYSDRVFQSYVDGTLTAFSVDFIPHSPSSGPATKQELAAHPEWINAKAIYRKWELAGYSCVSYPGNPEALALAVERGLGVVLETRAILRSMGYLGGTKMTTRTTTRPATRRSIEGTAEDPRIAEALAHAIAMQLADQRRREEHARANPVPYRFHPMFWPGTAWHADEYERWLDSRRPEPLR